MGNFVYIDSSASEKAKLGPAGGREQTKIYLQFVPGKVVNVICGDDDIGYTEPQDINSIMAVPHVGTNTNFDQVEMKRYYPLFRGMCDTPLKGDSVLLYEDAGQNYYIGPLNSGNSPNYNIDLLNVSKNQLINNTEKNTIKKQSIRDKWGIPINYILAPINRLMKKHNKKLDDPDGKRKGEEGSIAKEESFGDMILEGRFGNSIRLGSRYYYPHIYISNGRNAGQPVESINDSSLISITSHGSLRQHFNDFILGSNREDNTRHIAGGNQGEQEVFNYNFGSDNGNPILAGQLFMNSDKVTINSKTDNITLSAFNNLDMGAGNNLTINTKNYTSIESSNIYLGKQAQEQKEPLVLGEQLRLILEEIVDVLKNAHALVQGVPIPLTDSLSKPLGTLLGGLESKLNKNNPEFFSEYHYIESNGGSKN